MARLRYYAPETARVFLPKGPSRAAVYFAAFAAALYFPWRITTFNPDALALSIAMYAAELFGLVTILLHAFMTWRVLEREAPPPLPHATVDVFIPTYNEPVEMLRRTVMAARNMRYAHETYLLDDGNRPEMKALADQLGVHYLARADNKHAKAGNLNNALAHSSGEFIAIFDADHVPHRSFIERTLGYFADPKVSFVQTPQDFYNLDSFQHRRKSDSKLVWTEQSLFFRVIMPGKDYWNAAFFCGSCAIIRRAALEQIGGFATETVTEDLHTSVRLHKKGFGSIYHQESLAFGIAPATFEPYETQRVRWGQGAMQVWRAERIITGRGLTVPQRICYLASVLTYFDGWQKAFMFLLPSFVLVTGILPVGSLDWQFVFRFVPWYVLSLWACEELGRGYARSWTIEQYNFLRAPGFAFATLTFFFNRRLHFRVTRKGNSTWQENVRGVAPQICAILIGWLSLAIGVARYSIAPHMAFSALAFNVVWCVLTTYIAGVAIKFALDHSNQKRTTYRFRLPLAIKIIDARDRPHLLAVREISSGGFSALVPFTITVRPETRIEAALILPSGQTPVALDIRQNASVFPEDPTIKVLAARFLWPSQADSDALDLYLYGSDAEWRYGGLIERGLTPVEEVSRAVRRALSMTRDVGSEWRPAIIVPDDMSRSIEVLASEDDGSLGIAVLSRTGLPAGAVVALIAADGDEQIDRYRISTMPPHDEPGRIFFVYLLAKVAQPAVTRKDQARKQTVAA